MKDTAKWTDVCTCGHIRAMHMPIGREETHNRRIVCNSCTCDAFTKEPLTIYDELRERRTP